MKLPAAALLLIATSLIAQDASHTTPHRHATKTMTHASYATNFFIDTHADTTQRMLDANYDLTEPLNGGYLNFEAAKKGNLGAEFFSIWVEPDLYQGHYARRTLELIDTVHQAALKHPDKMMMAYSVADIERAHREHKLAALMGIEGGHSIENSLPLLRDYYRLGVRYMTLTWSNSNDWADSSGDINDPKVHHTKEGLTEFGKDVVYEMNRLGMMVDISHVADQTFYRTLILTRAPVIASHSSARALTNAPRNMTDEMLRALAVNGGVADVNFYSAFVSDNWRKAWDAQKPEREAAEKAAEEKARAEGKPLTYDQEDAMDKEWAAKIPRPPLSDLIDHIDHMVKVAGIDHVGIGSDFDGIPSAPEGIDSAADLPKITAALRQRGYSEADCRKIMGGNLLRVFAQVEKVSKQLQAEEKERPKITETQPFHK
ncbi:MAG TPA: dipeptidase [Acidobacteriaceae bacterium]|jgi:membrane dipeptidase